MRRWILILLAAAAALACSREIEPEELSQAPSGGVIEGVPLTVEISLPGMTPPTKGLSEGGELETLRLAVFGGSGYLKEYVEATPARTSDYLYESTDKDDNLTQHYVPCYNFTVTLAMSESHRIIHFLGNGPEVIPFGYDTSVMPVQLCSNGEMGYWQMIDLPNGIRAKRNAEGYFIDKYGDVISEDEGYFPSDYPVVADRGKTRYVADDATEAAFQEIPLIRNWAKIVISADNSKRERPDDEDANESNFTPIALAAVNVPSRGALVPYSAATGFIQYYHERSFPYLEDTVQYPGNLPSGTSFDDSVPSVEDFEYFRDHPDDLTMRNGVANASGGSVYLYERPAPSATIPPTFVLIYGYYDNAADPGHSGYYFYKVDLMETKKVTEGEKVTWASRYYPIYRNFKYQIIIKKIESQGHATPAAAAASAGSADVSADVTTGHLADISDGVGRLHVSPWMAKTFTREHDAEHPVTELSVFFSHYGGEADMSAGSVTVEALDPEDGGAPVIGNLSIGAPYDPDQHENPDPKLKGWRTISFTTAAPGRIVRSQTLRITGTHDYGRLYRDVIITIQPVQPMNVSCGESRITAAKNTSQSVSVSIPDGLVESMFPLEFVIEPQDRTLSPDNSVADNNLPVISGTSISEDADYAGKPTFQFVKTLSWEDYLGLPRHEDDDELVWRTFTCWFVTNRDHSATKVWVYNEFFDKASAQFTNYYYKYFQNFSFVNPITEESDVVVPVSFEMVEDPDLVYPMSYPTITIRPTGLRLEGDGIMPGDDPETYTFKPTSHKVTLNFISTTSYADEYSVQLDAEEYETGIIHTCRFPMVGLRDGHPLSTSSGANWANSTWSNVCWGYVNKDNNKTVLFGYKDHPDKSPTPVTISILSGLQQPRVFGTDVQFPYTPPARHATGDPTYHEFEFRTIGGNRNVQFSLSSPGYITETIIAGRFNGNIRTMRITSGNAFKTGNTYGFTQANPSFTFSEDNGKVKVEFSEISAAPSGYVRFDAGGTYTVTITSQNSNQDLFYVDFIFDNNSNKGPVRAPESFTPSVGTFERYPGSNNQFVWSIPRGHLSATLTFKAPDNDYVRLNTMYVKSMNGSLLFNELTVPYPNQ